jgi:AraC-like DNA-binding protein
MKHAHGDGAKSVPLERVAFSSARVAIGEWRCDPSHPDFHDTGPIVHFLVAFPRTSVRIRNAGGQAFVADPTVFTAYNAGQRYTREALHPDGDLCDWWSVDAVTARSMARAVDTRAPHDADRPFRFENGPADAALYLHQRTTLNRLRAGVIDALEVEERAMLVIETALAAAARAHGARRSPPSPAHRDLAEDAKALLGARFRERLTLEDIASSLGVSAFHLCRVFRRQTGGLLHRHLLRLRVRAALHGVATERGDLSAVAVDVGFCSHSHFTAAFVREFGEPPSVWRSRSAAPHQRGRSLRRL